MVLSTSPAPSRPACAQMRVLLASAARPAAYVRLHYMSSDTTRALAAALRRAEADRCLGVIIDLRNNPGARALPAALAAIVADHLGGRTRAWWCRKTHALTCGGVVCCRVLTMAMHCGAHHAFEQVRLY